MTASSGDENNDVDYASSTISATDRNQTSFLLEEGESCPSAFTLDEGFNRLSRLAAEDYQQCKLFLVADFLKIYGLLEKSSESKLIQIIEIFRDSSEKRIAETFIYLDRLGITQMRPDMTEVIKVLKAFARYAEIDRINKSYQWMEDSGVLSKCVSLSGIAQIFELLRNVYTEEDYSKLEMNIDWMKLNGVWSILEDGKQICKLLTMLKYYPQNILSQSSEYLKDCISGDEIYSVLNLLRGYIIFDEITIAAHALKSRQNLLNNKFLEKCIHNYYQHGKYNWDLNSKADKIVHSIYRGSDDIVDFYLNYTTYIIFHIYYRWNPAVEREMLSYMENSGSREYIIEKISSLLGEDHPFTQKYLNLALGYDNQDNPNGFLAVHQEMIKRSEDAVVHNPKSGIPGVALNLESLCQPRPYKPIHMPVNVWFRFFDELNNLPATDIAEFESMLNISWAKLISLRDSREIQALLDPLDSLKTSQNVSSHSQMLRAVLNNIQETGNTAAFLQLLVNITTCTTGKLNGIMHSHVLLNQGRALDESVLGSERFTQEIKLFLNEEFRRIREATLSNVVRHITHDGVEDQNTQDIDLEISHDIYYLRGIIGREIGLHFENETPSIDMDAYLVNETLRSKTKQELLDLFYQHYKVEDLIDRFHTMLNDGTLKITDDEEKANLTALIINLFLKDDAMDEEDPMMSTYDPRLVELDQDKKPKGLTKEAAKRLLILLGLLSTA